jgi:hypothetical protein
MKPWILPLIAVVLIASNGPARAQFLTGSGESSLRLPISSRNGSAGDPRPSLIRTHTAALLNDSTNTTVLYQLAELGYAHYTSAGPTAENMLGTSIGHTVSIGVVTAGAGTSGSPTILYQGNAPCLFDGTTVVGDIAIPSTTTDGQCHDSGMIQSITQQMAPYVQTLGLITSVNSGVGTLANVDFELMPLMPYTQTKKCVVNNNKTCSTTYRSYVYDHFFA